MAIFVSKNRENFNGKHFVFNMEKQTHQCSVKILLSIKKLRIFKVMSCNVLEHTNVLVVESTYENQASFE